ncbi:hypothetical protein [Pedobacter sp. Leaf41]|uniref:hypothetical protein n=1 Tax=Pedobacter sp. Leaf41 TaxID=1736218 RepID=UPI0012F7A99A|nr:hypothetical protein [Pedobacter sp. Leaf41]
MEQNSMLKRYLIIGLIISITSILGGCVKDFTMVGEFHFVNTTNYSITYQKGLEEFNVAPNSTTIFKNQARISKKKSQENNYNTPLANFNNIKISFNKVKCLIDIKEEDLNSVRNIKNYKAERVNDVTYKFTYTFTEADYSRAVNCP